MEQKKLRSYGYDNLRCFLVFCVVFAHLLEIIGKNTPVEPRTSLYFFIYCFHIPALIFLNGVFGRFSWSRALWTLLLYLGFQTIYRVFAWAALGNPLRLSYSVPYWHLWYLVTFFCCSMTIPVLSRIPVKWGWVPLVLSLVLSLWAGYEKNIGYAYSLSRTLVFLPYFVLGHYAGRKRKALQVWLKAKPKLWPWLLGSAAAATAFLYSAGLVTKKMLYGSYSYAIGYGPALRLVIFMIGSLWILGWLSLFLTRLDRKIPGISAAGQNSLSVFLLHGFVVRILGKLGGLRGSYLLALALAFLLLAAFGNPWVGKLLQLPHSGKSKRHG